MNHGIVFINASGDTFTPTRSGSLGPWVWEVCRAARASGVEPLVISKRHPDAEAFDWPNLRLVDWPAVSSGSAARFAFRVRRKLTGWSVPGMRTFAVRVAAAIRSAEASTGVFFLQNDPELTCYLRDEFPDARIISHFQNEHMAWPRFRGALGSAADQITACSQFTARRIETLYGLETGRVIPLHSGVDAERFFPASNSPTEPVVINYTGRLGADKAPDLLLRAAIKLAEKGQSFSLQFLGFTLKDSDPSPYANDMRQLVSRLANSGIKLRIPGHIDRWHIANELRQAHIHVMPSRWDEPFGLVTLEGMACGLATVASRTGGTPEVVGGAALTFERDDEVALTEHLHRLVTDAHFRRTYQLKARERALQFNWASCWQAVQQLFETRPTCSANPASPVAAAC